MVPDDLSARIDASAKALGQSFSEWMRRAAIKHAEELEEVERGVARRSVGAVSPRARTSADVKRDVKPIPKKSQR